MTPFGCPVLRGWINFYLFQGTRNASFTIPYYCPIHIELCTTFQVKKKFMDKNNLNQQIQVPKLLESKTLFGPDLSQDLQKSNKHNPDKLRTPSSCIEDTHLTFPRQPSDMSRHPRITEEYIQKENPYSWLGGWVNGYSILSGNIASFWNFSDFQQS